MKVLINEAGLVKTIIYDERGCLKGLNYIDVPDDIVLDPDKTYVYVDKTFMEIDTTNSKYAIYLEPDLVDKYNLELKTLLDYISSTDYISNKYTDLVLITNQMTSTEFISKYSEILHNRTEYRARISELKALLSK